MTIVVLVLLDPHVMSSRRKQSRSITLEGAGYGGVALVLGFVVSSCCGDVPPLDTSYEELFKESKCGDGTVDEWEECDLGEANSDEGPCSSECVLVGCGDYIIDEQDGEQCDDGADNKEVTYDVAGGCSIECTILPRCGDGVTDEGFEECDDGNSEETDACLPSCVAARCGDGAVEFGVEECDDGNSDPVDGCTNDCKLPGCGNGTTEGDEECDDGNKDDTDGCLSTCVLATCGDGITQAGEECDDGNTDEEDGCNNACARDRVVFVTSEDYQGGDFGSLDGADAECRALADAAELDNAMGFRAWLSDDTGSPSTRFFRSNGRYVLLDGRVVAFDWNDLTDGGIWTTIDVDESGTMINQSRVWSNTATDGTTIPGSDDCENWSAGDLELMGRQGVFGAIDEEWTDAATFNPAPCPAPAHLYCFEQQGAG